MKNLRKYLTIVLAMCLTIIAINLSACKKEDNTESFSYYAYQSVDLQMDIEIPSSSEYADVAEGDIIRYIVDSKNKVVAIEMLYDASADAKLSLSGNAAYVSATEGSTDFSAVYGTIKKKHTGTESADNKVEIDADKERIYKFSTSTKVFKLLTSGEVETSSMDEVYDGTDGMTASTVILITPSVSAEATAQTIYVIE